MKRLFVRPAYQHQGLGRALAQRVIREAGPDAGRRIERAFELVLARAPREGEKYWGLIRVDTVNGVTYDWTTNQYWAFWLNNTMAQTGVYGVTLWAPSLFVLLLKVTPQEAAKMMILLTVMGFIGRLSFSYLSDKIGRRAGGGLIGLGAGVLIILAALSILHEAWQALQTPRVLDTPWLGLAVNGLATAMNAGWALFLLNRSKHLRSAALKADGK